MAGLQRVLIVDDFADSAATSAMLLELLGYQCAVANSGQEALAVAERFAPEVVLLDIGLPDISGYEVARALRKGSRPVFIAAITGWGQLADRVKALEAGFDMHVLKPTDGEKLKQILARAGERLTPG